MMILALLPLLLLASSVKGDSLRGKAITVTSFACPTDRCPYLNRKAGYETLHGNDRYEGLMIDLLEELAGELHFNFSIHEVADGRYGMPTDSGEWNGMVGELIRGEADLIAADMTITANRESVVDFTHPFMYLGLGVLYNKAGLRHKAARLGSLADLVRLDSVKIGTVMGGSTMNYLKDSKVPLFQNIWSMMNMSMGLGAEALVSSNPAGMDRVLDEAGGYAFIMESPSLEYMVARNCELTQVGKVFNKKSYGLALPQGSPYRDELSQAILRMQESDRMLTIINKWIGGKGASCHPASAILETGLSMLGSIQGML